MVLSASARYLGGWNEGSALTFAFKSSHNVPGDQLYLISQFMKSVLGFPGGSVLLREDEQHWAHSTLPFFVPHFGYVLLLSELHFFHLVIVAAKVCFYTHGVL